MVEFTETDRQMLQETHDAMLSMKTCLLGANHGTNDRGLVGKVEDVCKSHYSLTTKFWILVALLVGSGVISGTVIAALNGVI